jgi:hypothetical protein
VTLIVAKHPSTAFHGRSPAGRAIGGAQQPKDHCAGADSSRATTHHEVLLPLPFGGNCRLFR